MRTTVELDEDTARAVEALRRAEGLGTSEAVNSLIRRALLADVGRRPRFAQRSRPLSVHLDVSNIAEAMETLDGPTAPG